MSFLDVHINLRINKKQVDIIEDLLKNFPDNFDNASHVVRCAVNNFYEDYKKKVGDLNVAKRGSVNLGKNKPKRI